MDRIDALPLELQMIIYGHLGPSDVLSVVAARLGGKNLPQATRRWVGRAPEALRHGFFWSSALTRFLTFVHRNVSESAFYYAREGHSVLLVSDWSPFQKTPPAPLASFQWVPDARDVPVTQNCLPPRLSGRRFRAQVTLDRARIVQVFTEAWRLGHCAVRLGLHSRFYMQSGPVFHPEPFASCSYNIFHHSMLHHSPAWADAPIAIAPCA